MSQPAITQTPVLILAEDIQAVRQLVAGFLADSERAERDAKMIGVTLDHAAPRARIAAWGENFIARLEALRTEFPQSVVNDV